MRIQSTRKISRPGPEQGEHHEQHPDQRRVGVEVLGKAAAHAGKLRLVRWSA